MKRGKGDLVYYPSSPLLLSPAWLTELLDPVISGISDHEVPTASCRSFSPPASATFLPFAGLTRGTSRRHHYYHNKCISWQNLRHDVVLWAMKCFATRYTETPTKNVCQGTQLCLVSDSYRGPNLNWVSPQGFSNLLEIPYFGRLCRNLRLQPYI